MARVITLPSEGTLIVATDLQGHVGDFVAVERVFEEATGGPGGAVLVITGDLVHGPEIDAREWPPHLGSYYHGDSPGVLERAEALQRRHPGRVHYLLGNHEHAHLGGPVVSKFFPNEAARLEQLLGSARASALRTWLAQWPVVAVAPRAGLTLTHGAPHVAIEGVNDLERLPLTFLDGPDGLDGRSIVALLWARTTTTERARAFLAAIDDRLTVCVYGHDVAPRGYAIDREPLLCISTSFGCHDGDKLYLSWDLRRHAESAAEVARDGLRPLYPSAPPVLRG